MTFNRNLIRTATALAAAGLFGVAHAQMEERTQIQKPSSNSAQMSTSGIPADRRDDTVRQTQQPSASSGDMNRPSGYADRRDDTVRQTQVPSSGGSSAGTHGGHNSQPSTADTRMMDTGRSMQPHMANRADMPMRNDGIGSSSDGMRMQNERMARTDRN